MSRSGPGSGAWKSDLSGSSALPTASAADPSITRNSTIGETLSGSGLVWHAASRSASDRRGYARRVGRVAVRGVDWRERTGRYSSDAMSLPIVPVLTLFASIRRRRRQPRIGHRLLLRQRRAALRSARRTLAAADRAGGRHDAGCPDRRAADRHPVGAVPVLSLRRSPAGLGFADDGPAARGFGRNGRDQSPELGDSAASSFKLS